MPRPSLGEDDLHGLWRSFDKDLPKGIHYFSWYDSEGTSPDFAGVGAIRNMSHYHFGMTFPALFCDWNEDEPIICWQGDVGQHHFFVGKFECSKSHQKGQGQRDKYSEVLNLSDMFVHIFQTSLFWKRCSVYFILLFAYAVECFQGRKNLFNGELVNSFEGSSHGVTTNRTMGQTSTKWSVHTATRTNVYHMPLKNSFSDFIVALPYIRIYIYIYIYLFFWGGAMPMASDDLILNEESKNPPQ